MNTDKITLYFIKFKKAVYLLKTVYFLVEVGLEGGVVELFQLAIP